MHGGAVTSTPADLTADQRLDAARHGMTLSVWASIKPDVPAIVSEHGDRSFADLNGRANQLVRALRRHGVQAGDGVALLCGNRAEFAEVVAATQRSGLRLTPINWHLTADEIAYILNDCEAKAVFGEPQVTGFAPAVALAPDLRLKFAVGGDIPGAERLSLLDALKWWEERFATITLHSPRRLGASKWSASEKATNPICRQAKSTRMTKNMIGKRSNSDISQENTRPTSMKVMKWKAV